MAQGRDASMIFLKEGAYRRKRKAAAQACKTLVRAPPPKWRAGKGACDMTARSHASRTGRLRRKECRGVLALQPCAVFYLHKKK